MARSNPAAGTRGRNGTAVIGTLGVLLAGMTALAAPAGASPTGTIILTGGSSGTPTHLDVLGASSSYVLFCQSGNEFFGCDAISTVPVGGGTAVTLSPVFNADGGPRLVGSLVTAEGFDNANHVSDLDFENANGTGAGSADIPNGLHLILAAGSSDGGYVWSRNANQTIEIGDLTTSGSVTDLATLPNSASSKIRMAASDASGLVVAYRDDNCDSLAEDIVFVPASGGSTTTLSHPSTCAVQYTDLRLAIGGGEAAWDWYDAATETSSYKYVATSGGTVGSVEPTFDNDAGILAVTATQLAFLGDNEALFTYPLGSGSPSMSSYRADEFSNLVSTGGSIVFDELAVPSTAGIYTTVSASATPAKIFSDGVDPLAASDVAVAPGQVGYEDNATPSTPIFTRSLTNSGSSLTDSAESLIASSSTGFGLSLSGTRAAYLDSTASGDTDLELATPGANTRTLWSTADDPDLHTGGYSPQLSGRRVLYPVAMFTNNAVVESSQLFDDVTGQTATASNAASAALWGNYLVTLDSQSGVITRKDLSTGQPTVIYTIPHAAGDTMFGGLAVWGNTVGWSVYVCGNSGCNQTPTSGYLTVAPGAAPGTPTFIPASSAPVLSSGYIAYLADIPGPTLVALPLTGGSPIDVTTTPCDDSRGSDFSLDDSTVAWLDCATNSDSDNGTAEAAPLPHVANPPWFLGDPQAPNTYDPSSGTWNADLVTSAALTDCNVVISQGSVTVKVLPCNAAGAALGEATASWNGTDNSGTPVPAGVYTWTLVASDADGSLLNYDGSTTPVTGPIVVFGQSSPPPTPAPTPTPTPTATTPGAPSGVLASPGDGQATISWTPPTDSGGSPITSYTVEDSTDGGTSWAAPKLAAPNVAPHDSPSTTDTVTGLTNGTSYVFRVAATNASGTGAYSNASNPVTPTGGLSASHLTIQAPLKIRAGHRALLATTLTDATGGEPIPDATVQLFHRTGGSASWQLVRATTTTADGIASIDVAPHRNTAYEWQYNGDTTSGAATSQARSVAVGQLVTIQVNSRRIRSGGTLKIYGSVNPATSGQVVQLQQHKHGRWVSTGMHARISRRALPDGTRNLGYLIVVTMQRPGVYQIRAHRSATSENAGGNSRVVTIRFT